MMFHLPTGPRSVVDFIFTPDAAPTAVVTTGNQQGTVYRTDDQVMIARELFVDLETTSTTLTITVQVSDRYAGDSDRPTLGAVSAWTTIGTIALGTTGFGTQSGSTKALNLFEIPANRFMRMNVDVVTGAPAGLTVTLRCTRALA